MTTRSKLISAFEKIKEYSSDMFDCEAWIEFDRFVSGTEYALEVAAEKAKAGMNFNFTGNVPYVEKESILNCLK